MIEIKPITTAILKSFYKKICGIFAKKDHTHDDRYKAQLIADYVPGNNDLTLFMKLCTLTIVTNYINTPIVITTIERGSNRASTLSILFKNVDNHDPELDSFLVEGSHKRFFIKKLNTSIWEIYYQKNEKWGNIKVTDFFIKAGTVNITWNCETVDIEDLSSYTEASFAPSQVANTLRVKYDNTSTPSTFNWVDGGKETPPWVLGGNLPDNIYVYNPAYFSVASVQHLVGFSHASSSAFWGNQLGEFVHGQAILGSSGTGNCDFAFRKNNPSADQLSMLIDGYFYQREGLYNCLDNGFIMNNLTTNETGYVLDASQGKVLNDKISTLTSNSDGIGNIVKCKLVTVTISTSKLTLGRFTSAYPESYYIKIDSKLLPSNNPIIISAYTKYFPCHLYPYSINDYYICFDKEYSMIEGLNTNLTVYILIAISL